eukprot:m.798483 g.798483  ORF g.798483 m.798483 type:complete len:1269 (+) comp23350_c0_seq2:179-3985(+)
MSTAKPTMQAPLLIGGVPVRFPFRPYPSQLQMMSAMIKAMTKSERALLESPTGSGKTMALLCAALAWQETEAANMEALHRVDSKPLPDDAQVPVLNVSSTEVPISERESSGSTTKDCSKTPKSESTARRRQSTSLAERFSYKPRLSTGSRSEDSVPERNSSDDEFKPQQHSQSSERRRKRKHIAAAYCATSSFSTTNDICTAERTSAPTRGTENNTTKVTKPTKAKRPPKIFFGTRTHKQISQVVRELRRSAYGRGVRMCILSSREHTCIHPVVSKSSSKNEDCSRLLKDGAASGGVVGGCSFTRNVKSLSLHPQLRKYGSLAAWDIEDLVRLGKRSKACPFFAARELLQGADIVFCPYNYLVDPIIRQHMGIDCTGQVIVIDEAHNIEDACRESASLSIAVEDLGMTVSELQRALAGGNACDGALTALHAVSESLHSWVASVLDTANCTTISEGSTDDGRSRRHAGSFDSVSKVLTGRQAALVFETFGITKVTVAPLRGHLEAVVAQQQDSEQAANEAAVQTRGRGPRNHPAKTRRATVDTDVAVLLSQKSILLLGNLFLTLEFMLGDSEDHLSDYKVVVEEKPAMVARDGATVRSMVPTLCFWCFNSAIAFDAMAKHARSVVLTSGTLSPLNTFSSELGAQFHHKVEANHVIDASQVWVGTLSTGMSNRKLEVTYANTDSLAFQDDIGNIILHICTTVPHGVLVFAPSYLVLDKLVRRWKTTGLWLSLCQAKGAVVLEPRGSNKNEFEARIKCYYDAVAGVAPRRRRGRGGRTVQKSAQKGSCVRQGALFLAVARGKVSEGLDFSDDNARAVISLGIPFPNAKDRQVNLKRDYNNQFCKRRGMLSGDLWYESQAFRALNQGLGRCIRHRSDWGAIVIIDCRFAAKQRYSNYLSKWVRKSLVHYATWRTAQQSLQAFVDSQAQSAERAGGSGESTDAGAAAVHESRPASRSTPAGGPAGKCRKITAVPEHVAPKWEPTATKSVGSWVHPAPALVHSESQAGQPTGANTTFPHSNSACAFLGADNIRVGDTDALVSSGGIPLAAHHGFARGHADAKVQPPGVDSSQHTCGEQKPDGAGGKQDADQARESLPAVMDISVNVTTCGDTTTSSPLHGPTVSVLVDVTNGSSSTKDLAKQGRSDNSGTSCVSTIATVGHVSTRTATVPAHNHRKWPDNTRPMNAKGAQPVPTDDLDELLYAIEMPTDTHHSSKRARVQLRKGPEAPLQTTSGVSLRASDYVFTGGAAKEDECSDPVCSQISIADDVLYNVEY